MRVCLLGNISVELQFCAWQFMLSVSFDARWHSSFQDSDSIILIQEFNDSWDGKTNLGGGKNGFSILGSETCAFSVALMENNSSWNMTQCKISVTMQYSLTLDTVDKMTNFKYTHNTQFLWSRGLRQFHLAWALCFSVLTTSPAW